MRKNQPQWEGWQVNHIANITIVDGFLNKNKIRAKAPSVYMNTFRDQNAQLEVTMKTHLIGDLDEFGIWDDDYEKFFDNRIKAISEELGNRIISQKSEVPLEQYEDVEETEEIEN